MASNAKIREVLQLIVEGWRNVTPPSEVTAKLWTMALADMSDIDLENAFLAHMRNPDRGQFAPKPADIIAAHQADKADDIESFVGEVIEKITRGRYRVYSPHGSTWDARAMREELGPLVVAAWVEAGGGTAFDDLESAKFATKRLGELLRIKTKAATSASTFDPKRALAVATQNALPPKAEPRQLRSAPPPSHEEAVQVMANVDRVVKLRAVPKPKTPEEIAARLDALKAQRDELLKGVSE